MDCNTPEFPVNHQLPELAQTRVHRVGDAIQPCHPLSSSSPPAFNLFPASGSFPMSQFFTWEGQRTGFCFSISPSNEYSGLISFRIDWLDLLAVQRTLKSLLQHQSSEVSILWHSAFFTVQLSHPYVTTRKNIALTRWTFVISTTLLYLPLWAKSLGRNGVALSQQKSPKCNTWMQFQKW